MRPERWQRNDFNRRTAYRWLVQAATGGSSAQAAIALGRRPLQPLKFGSNTEVFMGKVMGGLCCLIVGLQVLIGVPLVVSYLFLSSAQNGAAFPVAVAIDPAASFPATLPPNEYSGHSAGSQPPKISPPPNLIPATPVADHPMLAIRQEQGSPLAGTVLADESSPQEENQLFLTALEQAAQDRPVPSRPACTAEGCFVDSCPAVEPAIQDDKSQLVAHLYQMAQIDEDGGQFERADKWRKLARELRAECPGHAEVQE